ncbi:MAG TPA: response regulator [Rariglobus sp.]|jgi:CheY-like chemotaxis protein|nr:response regulator [Rariglobus sp.]
MARILLIDDDDDFRAMLRLTLTHFGHTVIEACDGKEGLTLFPGANSDLVITDIVMPEKEGLEVVMELRKRRPSVKIIVMSGGARNRSAGYLQTAKALGASTVLEKPFSNGDLLTAINQLLPAVEQEAAGI